MRPVTPLGTGVLTGRFIALEPLEPRHHDGLIAAAGDHTIWQYIPFDASLGFAPRLADFAKAMQAGHAIVYVVRRLSDDMIVGSTSYLAISPGDARVEIGATWYTADAQGSVTNPEAKYLLLQNAFNAGYSRVEFKTHSKNARSRAALKKLGATEEGTLRAHMWMPQGHFRDSVYFSILATEWPGVKRNLETRLAAFR